MKTYELSCVFKVFHPFPRPHAFSRTYLGSGAFGAPRQVFGEAVVRLLSSLSHDERRQRVLVVDNDLEGSCGLKKAPFGAMYRVPKGLVSGGFGMVSVGFGCVCVCVFLFSFFCACFDMFFRVFSWL